MLYEVITWRRLMDSYVDPGIDEDELRGFLRRWVLPLAGLPR